jgi:hypothetical protein
MTEEEEAIDWLGGLADETWQAVAGYLGLYALSLRATCSTLHGRVLALKELPVAIQLARRVLHRLDVQYGPDVRYAFNCYGVTPGSLYVDREPLRQALRDAGPRELTGMLDAFNHSKRLKFSGRPCRALFQQLQNDTLLWSPIEAHMERLARLEKNWNGQVLSDRELVEVIHGFHIPYETAWLARLFRNVSDGGHWTTTWHLAAFKGNKAVLNYFYLYCIVFPTSQTPGGNHAIAHARRGLEQELAFFRAMGKPERAVEVAARYAEVIAFLQERNVPDREWRTPPRMANDYSDSDSESEYTGSAMDMLDEALGAQMSAG